MQYSRSVRRPGAEPGGQPVADERGYRDVGAAEFGEQVPGVRLEGRPFPPETPIETPEHPPSTEGSLEKPECLELVVDVASSVNVTAQAFSAIAAPSFC